MRNEILIVDDEELNRELLRQIFEDTYKIITASDGKEALELFDKHRNKISAVLLDLVMPKVSGYQVLKTLSAWRETETIPIILITANADTDTALKCYSAGAAEIINKPFVAGIVRQRVMNMTEMYSSRETLRHRLDVSEGKLIERERQLEEFNDNFIDTISNVVEFRDMESGQHIKRVKGLTQIMAHTYMSLYPDCGLTQQKIGIIVRAAALHDIGKIAIPDSILLKPGRLTAEEFEIMKSHTTRGCDILTKLENVQDEEHYKIAYEIIRHHHERYDGKGYPDGLKGDEIPISAGLVSVADVYDALTTKRVYKDAFDGDKAYRMIKNGECGTFGPKLMECFDQAESIMRLFVESTADKEI